MEEGNEPTRWRVLICICLKWQVREHEEGAAPWLGFSPLLLGVRVKKSSDTFLPPLLCSEGGQGVNSQAGISQGLHAKPGGASSPCRELSLSCSFPRERMEKCLQWKGYQALLGSLFLERFRGCGTQGMWLSVGLGSAGFVLGFDIKNLFFINDSRAE